MGYASLNVATKERRHLDKFHLRAYANSMNIIHRTLVVDTDARLRETVGECGQDVAEDRRRLDEFRTTRAAVPLAEVKNWVTSWGSATELPRPTARRIE